MNPTSTSITARCVGMLVAVAAAVTLVVHTPVVRGLGDELPALGFGDPYIQAWQVAWGGHALTNDPLGYFDANTFYPETNSLAFTDALIGYAPTAIFGGGTDAAAWRYGLLFLFAYILAFVGAALLARGFGLSWVASGVAGAVFAFAPFRIDQATHLHVISSGGIPLAAFLLWRGYERESPRLLVTGWAVAAWQVSLGFTLGLPLIYGLVVAGAFLGFRWHASKREDRDAPPKKVVVAAAAGLALFLAWSALQALPYLRVADEHPQAAKPVEEVEFFSPPPSGYFAAPEGSILWGVPTSSYRAALNWPQEQSLYPGAIVILLVGLGLTGDRFTTRTKAYLLATIVGIGLLALGFRGPFGGGVYQLLYDLLPGWQAIRTPGRLVTFAYLPLAVLAAAGAARIGTWVAASWHPRMGKAAVAVAVALVVAEGAGGVATTPVPEPPAELPSVAGPQFHIPADEIADRLYTFWSIDGFPEMGNGLGSFTPDTLGRLRSVAPGFPNEVAVEAFRRAGIRSVVVHRDRVDPSLLDALLTEDVSRLGVTRSDLDGIIVFDLSEGS